MVFVLFASSHAEAFPNTAHVELPNSWNFFFLSSSILYLILLFFSFLISFFCWLVLLVLLLVNFKTFL